MENWGPSLQFNFHHADTAFINMFIDLCWKDVFDVQQFEYCLNGTFCLIYFSGDTPRETYEAACTVAPIMEERNSVLSKRRCPEEILTS